MDVYVNKTRHDATASSVQHRNPVGKCGFVCWPDLPDISILDHKGSPGYVSTWGGPDRTSDDGESVTWLTGYT
jgi:hypothetical protein